MAAGLPRALALGLASQTVSAFIPVLCSYSISHVILLILLHELRVDLSLGKIILSSRNHQHIYRELDINNRSLNVVTVTALNWKSSMDF